MAIEVVHCSQFRNAHRIGPIGMPQEKGQATMMEQAHVAAGCRDGGTGEELSRIVRQLGPTPGLPLSQAVRQRCGMYQGSTTTRRLPSAGEGSR